jgi:hypothetical protein
MPYYYEEALPPLEPGKRVENLGANNHAYYERTGCGSSTYDICLDCAILLDIDPHAYDEILVPYNGEEQGEDGWGGDCAHPSYNDDEYLCKICGVILEDPE